MGSSRNPTFLELEPRLDGTLKVRLDDEELSLRRMLFVFGFCG